MARDQRVGGDLLVEDRLGEGGLVGLVVAVAPVAIHVDEHVAVELLRGTSSGELGDHADGLGIVAVHVEDRGLDHLGDVGAVARRAGVAGIGGEADLVVDDEVDGAARAVAGELREVEGLGDDALAGEGGVAVDEERAGPWTRLACRRRMRWRARALPSTTGIHDLEVATGWRRGGPRPWRRR